jgi:hypothetical protein
MNPLQNDAAAPLRIGQVDRLGVVIAGAVVMKLT